MLNVTAAGTVNGGLERYGAVADRTSAEGFRTKRPFPSRASHSTIRLRSHGGIGGLVPASGPPSGDEMRAGAAGAATVRHVGLVALESLLVAILVWIAAMTLAGANQPNGLVGTAEAGRDPLTVAVRPAVLGQTAVVTASRAPDGGWVHLACLQGTQPVLSQWARLDKNDRASVRLGPSPAWTSGSAACTAEIGYFSANGRWRVEASAAFAAAGS